MNTVNVRGYGSMVNAIGNQTRSKDPEVGMGVTELMYSDRHPYTVIEVLGPRKIRVQLDVTIRKDNRGESDWQEYDYIIDPSGPVHTLRLNKHGRWKMVGDPDGSTFLVGTREEYYDYTR